MFGVVIYVRKRSGLLFLFGLKKKIEGTANQRKKLDTQKLNINKFWRKALKHTCWLFFSILTALTFVGYFMPMQEALVDFFTFEMSFAAAATVWFFAFCTYGNAGWMREIMCLHMCPYARFQSAMFDKRHIHCFL